MPPKKQDKKERRRKWMKLLFFKLPLIFMILGVVLIGALKLVERYPDPLRQGFEEYLSRATGRNATIGKLEEIKFFPNFIISARNITVHNLQNAAIIDLEIKEFDISTPFLSAFANTQKLNRFSLKNLKANKNMIVSKELEVLSSELMIENGPDKFGSFIIAEGFLGGKKVQFEMEVEAGKYSYKIPSSFPFSLRVGAYELNATLERGFQKVMLSNAIFSKGAQTSGMQVYHFSGKGQMNEDNPLTCLLNQENLNDCDRYLTKEN